MAAKGTEGKAYVFDKIKEIFPEAFMDGKVLRIPYQETTGLVEIKVSLTAAKDLLGGDGGAFSTSPSPSSNTVASAESWKVTEEQLKPTEEEKKNIEDFLSALGL